MSESRRNSPSIPEQWLSDAWIDRLVDGELSEADYRAVIAALDRHPAHWRRCAQAFLEAQALRGDLSQWLEQDDLLDIMGVSAASPPSHDSTNPVDGLLALADRIIADGTDQVVEGTDKPRNAVGSMRVGLVAAESPSVSSAPEDMVDGLPKLDGLSDDEDEDEDEEGWDEESRLQVAALPQASVESSSWVHAPRSWTDWVSPIASVAILCVVFAAGWSLSSRSIVTEPSLAITNSNSDSPAVATPRFPMGHVRLAVDGGQQGVEVPYFFPRDYPQAATSRNQSSVEELIRDRAVERQRMVMPGRLDERRDVLLPIEVISIPAETEFQ